MLSSDAIRRQFIDFFVDRYGHSEVPSSPVVPHDDPTLLFANAGMNQFKDVFLGIGTRPYSRAVDTQKCIRAGGKHNDLDDVGKDTYHHTFFEMLGNWSFGDYFKKEAIGWAWELLTEVWGLDKRRLHATVFAGDAAHGLDPDAEAADLWRSETDIAPERIHFCGAEDNFWEMGDTGPCGPCSEIHIDLTPDCSGARLVNAGDARVIEIWNLVFIQFNRGAGGKLTPLPAMHVDTGLGLERVAAVLQHKSSNYDTDVFTPLFEAIGAVTGAAPYSSQLAKPEDVAYRVIADHIRALTFALTDGAEITADGRGYVLRRILRRAVRYGRQTLGVREPFFHRLVPAVVDQMGDAFPELRADPASVAEKIRDEEEQFTRTLDRGIELFEQAAARGGKAIAGKDAFELYATYGFPLDLTQLMAEERDLTVDTSGFDAEMARHQQVSRGTGGQVDARQSLLELVQQCSAPATEFLGYDHLALADGRLIDCFVLDADGNHEARNVVSTGATAALVVERTPFYAEAGGQVGDCGSIVAGDARFRVDDTIRIGSLILHLGALETGTLQRSSTVSLRVDESRRQRIMIHHTATHLLNRALRAVLGDGVQQRGSLVDEQKTRFDFSHGRALPAGEVERIESIVREDINRDLAVHATEAPQEAALGIHGLRAVFGEKYPPTVRVVSIGESVEKLLADPDNAEWYDSSIEFCGGTHLSSTGAAGAFTLVGEEAVAKGVRRVTAVAGHAARQAIEAGKVVLDRIATLRAGKSEPTESAIAELIESLQVEMLPLSVKAQARTELGELQKTLKERQKQQAKQTAGQVVEVARALADKEQGPVIVAEVAGADADALRTAMDVIHGVRPEAALLLAAAAGDKVAFVARVSKDHIGKGLKAGDWVREVAKVTGGGGGGRPDMAQAGGKDPSKLSDALQTARAYADKFLG